MSLKIYNGCWIEDLAEKLVEALKTERKLACAAKRPLEFLKVAVANINLGKCLICIA